MARLQKRKKCSISSGLNLSHFKSSLFNQTCSWQFFKLIFVICFLNSLNSVASQSILVPQRLNAGQNNTLLLISNKDTTGQLQLVVGDDRVLTTEVDFKKGMFMFEFKNFHLICFDFRSDCCLSVVD